MTSAPVSPARPQRSWTWGMLILLMLRLPSLVEPVGNDQSLYLYVADEIRRGRVPYLDAWDQKPPGIYFLYASLRRLWPHGSIVAAADLGAAAIVAWLLVVLGRRLGDRTAGRLAAVLFLLFGNPSIQRVSGVYVRGQCETFIAAAAAAAIVLVARDARARWHVVLAGVWLGVAFWLKYNAITYALPLAVAGLAWMPRPSRARLAAEATLVAGGFALVSLSTLLYFAAHHALAALWQATIAYNLSYSGDTYAGATGPLRYLLRMPLEHARMDMLWFLGLAGVVAIVALAWRRERVRGRAVVALAWLAAAIVSIAINGARDLPQYFVQAEAPLALTAAMGLVACWRAGMLGRALLAVVVLAGLWRVGTDTSAGGLRWGGLPQLVENVRFDSAFMIGHIDRSAYLARFKGGQKYDAAAIDDLTHYVETHTAPSDRILVFGFAPGVYVESGRESASRFFWSRPVIYGFDAGQPGYGASGLVADLERTPPVLVALQRRDWFPDVANSIDYFLGRPSLADWLHAHYALDRDDATFSVWRRRS